MAYKLPQPRHNFAYHITLALLYYTSLFFVCCSSFSVSCCPPAPFDYPACTLPVHAHPSVVRANTARDYSLPGVHAACARPLCLSCVCHVRPVTVVRCHVVRPFTRLSTMSARPFRALFTSAGPLVPPCALAYVRPPGLQLVVRVHVYLRPVVCLTVRARPVANSPCAPTRVASTRRAPVALLVISLGRYKGALAIAQIFPWT